MAAVSGRSGIKRRLRLKYLMKDSLCGRFWFHRAASAHFQVTSILTGMNCFETDKLIKMLAIAFIVFSVCPIGNQYQCQPFVLWLLATDLQYSPSPKYCKAYAFNRWSRQSKQVGTVCSGLLS